MHYQSYNLPEAWGIMLEDPSYSVELPGEPQSNVVFTLSIVWMEWVQNCYWKTCKFFLLYEIFNIHPVLISEANIIQMCLKNDLNHVCTLMDDFSMCNGNPIWCTCSTLNCTWKSGRVGFHGKNLEQPGFLTKPNQTLTNYVVIIVSMHHMIWDWTSSDLDFILFWTKKT